MGAMFIGQQYLQNVLGYSTLEAGAAIIPAALMMVIVAPRSAKIVEARGARFTLLLGYVFVLLGFATMLAALERGQPVLVVALGYALGRRRRRVRRHAGVALADRIRAGAARRDGLGHRRPAARPRRRDHAVDLRGAADRRATPRPPRRRSRASPDAADITTSVQNQLTKSFAGAEAIAAQYPQYATPDPAGAKASFLDGDRWAYLAGIIAVLSARRSCSSLFPSSDEERRLLESYHEEDTKAAAEKLAPAGSTPVPSPA